MGSISDNPCRGVSRNRGLQRKRRGLTTAARRTTGPLFSTAPQGSLAKGSWHRRCLRDSQLGLSQKHKPMWKPASLGNPPASASRGTPLSQGGLWAGRRYRAGQGSNESLKAIVRIDSGGTPQGSLAKGSWQKSLIFD